VLTDSEFSKSELVRYARIPAEKIQVIPLGCEHIRRCEPECGILTRLGLHSRGYILAVGSQSPHKNFRTLAEALEYLPDPKLNCVVVGASNPRVFDHPSTMLAPKLTIAGYLPDGELRALYEHAACFVYPSLYEGFGLPPLEAMNCGCPVVVSRAASLPEVCGSAAIYCDARSPASVAESIQQVVSDRALQDQLRDLGRQRALKFSWLESARALLGLIEEAATP
jgi:glycosyltransferase involved in cell wall biosynthesis